MFSMSKVGDGGYHLIFNNCQHFGCWCATGDHLSEVFCLDADGCG
jgi:hypothetical protein